MTIRHLSTAVTAGLVACGLAALVPASGRAQQASALPAGEGEITLVGCFAKDHVKGHDTWVLANPTVGPATTVTESACSTAGGEMVKLEKVKKHHLGEGLGVIRGRHEKDNYGAGYWAEVTGKLEKIHGDGDADDVGRFRHMEVASIRAVPVAPPRAAEVLPAPAPVIPAPAPIPEVTPAPTPAPAPVQTTGVEEPKKKLPKTASPLPLIALLGFGALAGGLTLLADRRRSLGRG